MFARESVVDKKVFLVLSGECEKIINTRKRLPDFVFQRSFARYFVIEHAHIFTKEFGSFLFKVWSIFEDESVNYMTLDPDPVDYYYRHFSFFGLASFRPARLVERYVPVMSRDGNVDSFRARGGVDDLTNDVFQTRDNFRALVTSSLAAPEPAAARCWAARCSSSAYTWPGSHSAPSHACC
jgi:hypothetical protein